MLLLRSPDSEVTNIPGCLSGVPAPAERLLAAIRGC